MSLRQEFVSAINANQSAFSLKLPTETIDRLADYFELVQEDNPLLHLVAPCPPEEFAVRHVLESLTLLEYLPEGARFADVGTGAGLPSIPCLIVRGDLGAVAIESKEKKAAFLEKALNELRLSERAIVMNRQFEEIKEKDFSAVTCRALDRFIDRLPRIVRWSGQRHKIFFGGQLLGEELVSLRLDFEKKLIPMSERRYIFSLK